MAHTKAASHGPTSYHTSDEPAARFWHCSCLVEGKWFIYGGRYNPERGLAEPARILHQFDLTTEEWNRIEASGTPPKAIYSIATTSIGQYLYSFGGSDCPFGDVWGHYYNTLHRLDTRTKEWKKLTPKGTPPDPRRGAVMIAYEHLLVIFGGYCVHQDFSESTFNDLACYDTKKGEY